MAISLTHPDKIYFPEAKLAKRDIAQHYADVAGRMVPHLAGRPLSLVRCPDGWTGQCFYQKHADDHVDKSVARVAVPEAKGTATYFSAGSSEALVSLVQWGVIELHPWGSRVPRLDRPDRLVFDFDPDETVNWKTLVEGAGVLRTLLEEMGLRVFLKTTGGKGLHVVVPIRATIGWPQAKAFAKGVAQWLAANEPDRFTAALAKDQRGGKIFIDYLRNAEGATAVAPYSVRARKNAPVATPIEWKELAKDVRHDYFNVRNVAARLAKADPWAEFAATKQSLTKAMLQRVA
jgi:bifunctional non-homologous end joining protein LigD